jgi:predicted transcriptional regulator
MVSGLAYYLSQKFKPELTQQMKLLYEDELQRALEEDGSSSSSFITPKIITQMSNLSKGKYAQFISDRSQVKHFHIQKW